MPARSGMQDHKLSIVIPAHNEEGCIKSTIITLNKVLKDEKIVHEILVVNDHSHDTTEEILKTLNHSVPELKYVNNLGPNGFGNAVRYGLERFSGDVVAVYMADASDSPHDLVAFYRCMLSENVACVFGTRFNSKSVIKDYPKLKLVINRIANIFIQVLFQLPYNDVTNAFKIYRKSTIDGLKPFLSPHFNLTVELPLKAIIRGYSYAVLPNSWTNRKAGESKLRIKEMGSRYLFIVLYCLIEKWLTGLDYKKQSHEFSQLRQQQN